MARDFNVFAKMAKFRQIWSHCLHHPHPVNLCSKSRRNLLDYSLSIYLLIYLHIFPIIFCPLTLSLLPFSRFIPLLILL